MRAADRPSFLSWDETRISCQDLGNPRSGRTLAFVNGLFGTESCWVHLHHELGADHRLLAFDLRGHGRSGPPADPRNVTVDATARDVRALLDHAGVETAVLLGFSTGVQVVLAAWRLFPERVRGLVAATGAFEDPLGSFYGLGIPRVAWRATAGTLARFLPRTTNRAWHAAFRLPGIHRAARLVRATRADGPLMEPFYRHQAVVDVPVALRMALAAAEHSARDVLPTVRVPVLVIAGGKDTFTPAAHAETLQREIPGAEVLLVPEGTHTTLLEAPDVVVPAVRAFLGRVRWEDQPADGGP